MAWVKWSLGRFVSTGVIAKVVLVQCLSTYEQLPFHPSSSCLSIATLPSQATLSLSILKPTFIASERFYTLFFQTTSSLSWIHQITPIQFKMCFSIVHLPLSYPTVSTHFSATRTLNHPWKNCSNSFRFLFSQLIPVPISLLKVTKCRVTVLPLLYC